MLSRLERGFKQIEANSSKLSQILPVAFFMATAPRLRRSACYDLYEPKFAFLELSERPAKVCFSTSIGTGLRFDVARLFFAARNSLLGRFV